MGRGYRDQVRWRRLGLGGVLLAVVAWVALTRGDAVLASHPAYAVLLAVAGLAALVAVVTGLRRSTRPARRAGALRRVLVPGLQVVGVLVLAAALAWLRPLPASDVAVAAMDGGDGVTVQDRATEIVLVPTAAEPRAGLVFWAGALVDPRAYVPLLSDVARQGYEVHVVKPPLGVAFLALGAGDRARGEDDSVTTWVSGGHSLGGVAASSDAGDRPDDVAGLLLWASYPASSLAADTDLTVTSVSGTADGLATGADIEASRADLPPGTTFVAVAGGIHALFGDYGPQSGDGEPTVSRAQAQEQVVAASVALLDEVAGGG